MTALDQSERLAQLWTEAQPTVAAFIASLVPDFHQTEDILGRVAVVLVRKFDDYDADQPFVPWVLGIAKYEVLKARRTKAIDRHVFSEQIVERIEATCERMAVELSPRRQLLRECLKFVHGRARRALELRYVDDLSPPTIAERLEIGDGAVRTLLHRTRVKVRDCIERRLAGEVGR